MPLLGRSKTQLNARDSAMPRRHTQPDELIGLPTAAILVYHEVMGTRLSFQEVCEMSEVLQRVAHAISNVSPIYGQAGDAATREPLSQVDLLFGVFQRGATLFRTPYAEYTNLAIRRADVYSAIAILRGAGVRF